MEKRSRRGGRDKEKEEEKMVERRKRQEEKKEKEEEEEERKKGEGGREMKEKQRRGGGGGGGRALQEVLEVEEVWLQAVCSALVDEGCFGLRDEVVLSQVCLFQPSLFSTSCLLLPVLTVLKHRACSR